jgi:CRP/FNR family cyclic AMP-dependent transcriptional regulator
MARADELVDRLRTVPLFQGLREKELRSVAARMRQVEHASGAEILEEGGSAAGFHLILDGRAAVAVHGRPRRTLGPGEVFGEMSLIDGRPRSASVTADGPLRTASLSAWEFEPLLDEHPEIARALLRVLADRLRGAEADGVG